MSTFITGTDRDCRQAENPVRTIGWLVKARRRLFARFSAALHETRQREAARVISRYRHLVAVPGQGANPPAPKDACDGSY